MKKEDIKIHGPYYITYMLANKDMNVVDLGMIGVLQSIFEEYIRMKKNSMSIKLVSNVFLKDLPHPIREFNHF